MLAKQKKFGAVVGLVAFATLSLAACSGSSNAGSTTTTNPPTASAMATPTANPAADLVGTGCAAYAKSEPSGAGSVMGMAQDPVATAASNNPLLTTLTAAVSGKLNPKVNLVDTLNSGQFTVFAPVDSAFAKIPAATINTLKTDTSLLTSILTYHVVPGRLSPSQIDGTHTTAEGATLKVTGSGDNIMVNNAKVICGGVQTANATVYLVDTVLMPPAK